MRVVGLARRRFVTRRALRTGREPRAGAFRSGDRPGHGRHSSGAGELARPGQRRGGAWGAVAPRRQRRDAGRGASRRKTNPKPLPLHCWRHVGFEVGWPDARLCAAVRGLTFWGIRIRFSPFRSRFGRLSFASFRCAKKRYWGSVDAAAPRRAGGRGDAGVFAASVTFRWGRTRPSSRCTRNRLRPPPRNG